MRSKLLLVTVLVMALLAMLTQAAMAANYGETVYRGVVIGNENYTSGTTQGAITDATRMKSALQAANEAGSRYQEPTMRTNLKPAEIKTLVNDMLGWGIDEDDVTLLFFAGQGALDSGGAACLIGQDGALLKVSELRTQLDKIAGTKIVVMDLRYPEDIQQKSKLGEAQAVQEMNTSITDTFRGGTTEQKYQLIVGSTMLKSVATADAALEASAGLFSYYLVEGCGYDYTQERSGDMMADANQNGAVSLKEARDYVNQRAQALAAEKGISLSMNCMIYPDDSQYPLLSRRGTTEILSVSIDQPALSIAAGKNAKLNATITPINAKQRSVTWFSSDLAVATIDEDGLVKGLRQGEITVTAMAANGMTADCKVLVRNVTFAESVALSASKLVVGAGREELLKITMKPSSANELVSWKSNDTSIASVNENGLVQTFRNGNAVITATTEGGKEITCVIQVVDPSSVVTDISLDKSELSLYEGEAELVSAKIKPAKAADDTVVWTSSDESVVGVETNGLIAGIGPGEATVTATASSGISKQIKVKVKAATVVFPNKEVTLKKGKKTFLKYSIEPKGTMLDIRWESSNPEVATITDKGGVEALADGETAITATLPSGMKAVLRLSVASVSVKGVKLNKAKLSLSVGDTYKLNATIAPANATIKNVSWRSGSEKVATVDDAGNVTAMGVGKTTIVGRSHNGKVAKCQLVVKPVQVNKITLSEESYSFMLGVDKELLLAAELEPVALAGNRALKWESSNKKVATVDQTGLVKPVGAGSAVIRASSGKVKADCKITVGTNRTYNKKPKVGKGSKVFESLREVCYKDGHLVISMYYVNRTKKPAKIPTTEGVLTLTLKDGQVIELEQVVPSEKKLGAGKKTALSYTFPLADNENLAELDLRGAQVSIVRGGDALAATAPTSDGADAADALITSGAQ